MTFETTPAEQQPRVQAAALGGRGAPQQRQRMLGVVALAVAAVAVFSWINRSHEMSTTTIHETITRVELTVAAGNVTITGEDAGPVQLTSRTDDGVVRAAEVTHEIRDRVLYIEGECTGGQFLPALGCRTAVALTVPAGTDVVATTVSGTIEAQGLTGHARLVSDAGNVEVTDQAGALRARSAEGDVLVTGLSADEAYVTSSIGSVEVDLVDPPRSLDAESSAGAVSVTVPAGHSYDVEAKSRGGRTTVDVATNYSSLFKIRAFSGSGPVAVTDR